MSKLETPIIERYWESIRGTLIEEFPVVEASATCGPRRVDAVLLPEGAYRRAHWREVSLAGQHVIVVQAKANRLGMYLMGQAVFSLELIRAFRPASARSVALCTKDDSVLRPLLARYPDVGVVVVSDAGVTELP